MNIQDILDREELYARIDDDEELLQELIELFLEDYPQLMSEIKAGIEQRNATLLRKAAHTLKGSVGNFCVRIGVDTAHKLEVAGANSTFTSTEQEYVRLVNEMKQVEKALQSIAAECAV